MKADKQTIMILIVLGKLIFLSLKISNNYKNMLIDLKKVFVTKFTKSLN